MSPSKKSFIISSSGVSDPEESSVIFAKDSSSLAYGSGSDDANVPGVLSNSSILKTTVKISNNPDPSKQYSDAYIIMGDDLKAIKTLLENEPGLKNSKFKIMHQSHTGKDVLVIRPDKEIREAILDLKVWHSSAQTTFENLDGKVEVYNKEKDKDFVTNRQATAERVATFLSSNIAQNAGNAISDGNISEVKRASKQMKDLASPTFVETAIVREMGKNPELNKSQNDKYFLSRIKNVAKMLGEKLQATTTR